MVSTALPNVTSLLTDPAVLEITHAAFAAAAGTSLSNGIMPGLHVEPDTSVPAIDVDLYHSAGFQVRVNPTWAMARDPQTITETIESILTAELV